MKNVKMKPICFMILLIVFSSCSHVNRGGKGVDIERKKNHSMLKGAAVCSECHDDKPVFLEHTPVYATKHKFPAGQSRELCGMCHKDSFCFECHPGKEEIKPGDKFRGKPERVFSHRGDYITRHKIDARVNPIGCVKCHGRSNNERCRACHK